MSSFFVVVLAEQYASAAVWHVADGQVVVDKKSEDHVWQDEDSCVMAVDQSLQDLGDGLDDVSETLFALPNDWVNADGIVVKKKPLFQRLTKELLLEPVGFVVSTEAMSQHVTALAPQLHVLLLEVGITQLTVVLIKAGQIKQTVPVGRSGDSISDVREALAHIEEGSLPAKLLLYSPSLSEEEVSEVQQQLMSFAWQTSYPFVQPPVIEVQAAPFVEIAVTTGGAAIAAKKGLLPSLEKQSTHSLEVSSAQDLGFGPSIQEHTVSQAERAVDTPVVVAARKVAVTAPPGETQSQVHATDSRSFWRAHWKYILTGVLAGLLLLVGSTLVVAMFFLRATVAIRLKQVPVTSTLQLILDSKISVSDPDKLRLKATVVPQTAEAERTVATTGKKLVGDKATGTVTLYNYTSSQKTFAAGTKLQSGDKAFALNQAVTIASASSSLDAANNMITKPATQDAAVIATTIGEDWNLPASQEFLIENFTKETYKASNQAAFSGGSSREIQAVSAQDREGLVTALRQELMTTIARDAKATAPAGTYRVVTPKVKVVQSVFSGEVGEETNALTLKLTLQNDVLEYSSSELLPLARKVLERQLPPDYALRNEAPQILSLPSLLASTSAQVTLDTNLSAMAEPIIQLPQFAPTLTGKHLEEAEKHVLAHPGVAGVQISFSPALIGALWRRLPATIERITFTTL